MIEFIALSALFCLAWMMWRLYQAKQYNRFVDWLNSEVRPQLVQCLNEEFEDNRNELFPNTPEHIQAALYYYQQYPVRIFEAAVAREIIPPVWLESKTNKRHAAHLLYVQGNVRIHPVKCNVSGGPTPR
jgi:hypothetical protein